MKYKSFRIQNFKGIKDTTVELSSIAGANIFAFVGLNESGKTTILEAMHSFSPDSATSELLGGEEGLGVPYNERVPRHLIAEFTGKVSVGATVVVSDEDRTKIKRSLMQRFDLEIDTIPAEIDFERYQKFTNGDYINSYFACRTDFKVKNIKQRKYREPSSDERTAIRDVIYNLTPDIAYFPTFVFEFPEEIFLTSRGGVRDKFYRRVFQDILDHDGRGYTIDKDIVRRVRRDEFITPWALFWAEWSHHDDRGKIQQVMDRAGAAVTKLVFGRWNRIFGEDTRGKEIIISFDIIEGELEQDSGSTVKTQEHDVSIKFQVRDGTRRFNVNDRSLGFRWFFSFMLFTQFRVARLTSLNRPLLFLFDEPASNLHAAAQQKLIESFSSIAQGEHVLAYSTHSHYMIEPKWLEQTFIVKNRSDDPVSSILDEISLDDESLDVQVSTYRSFVDKHPIQTNYFQPILDRLEVVPSKFDIDRPSIVVEGKSDYYIIRYAQALRSTDELHLLPAQGAGTFNALASLHVGWNLNFVFMLDADKQGFQERTRYTREFGINPKRLVTIDELLEGSSDIEDLLDDTARIVIQRELELETIPNKVHLRRFFQERLACSNVIGLGGEFERRSAKLIEELRRRLQSV